MKKKNIIIICALISVITIAILIAILCSKANSSVSYEVFKAKADIKTYLNSVIDENYTKAVKYVALDNDNSEEAWIDRIESLADKDIMLSDYNDLDVRTVDGVITATVTLVISDLGSHLKLETEIELRLNENAGLFGIKYLTHDVTDEEIRLEIETALSGIVE